MRLATARVAIASAAAAIICEPPGSASMMVSGQASSSQLLRSPLESSQRCISAPQALRRRLLWFRREAPPSACAPSHCHLAAELRPIAGQASLGRRCLRQVPLAGLGDSRTWEQGSHPLNPRGAGEMTAGRAVIEPAAGVGSPVQGWRVWWSCRLMSARLWLGTGAGLCPWLCAATLGEHVRAAGRWHQVIGAAGLIVASLRQCVGMSRVAQVSACRALLRNAHPAAPTYQCKRRRPGTSGNHPCLRQ